MEQFNSIYSLFQTASLTLETNLSSRQNTLNFSLIGVKLPLDRWMFRVQNLLVCGMGVILVAFCTEVRIGFYGINYQDLQVQNRGPVILCTESNVYCTQNQH